MEFLIARHAHELLLTLMLPRVTQPVVLPHEPLSTCVASEPEMVKKKRKSMLGAGQTEMEMLVLRFN